MRMPRRQIPQTAGDLAGLQRTTDSFVEPIDNFVLRVVSGW